MSQEDLKKIERIDLVIGSANLNDEDTAPVSSSGERTIDRSDSDTISDAQATIAFGREFHAGEKKDELSNQSSESTESTDPNVGQTIAGRFEIISVLGEGGMSIVYKARHLMLDRLVALKLIHPGQMQAKAVMRFQQEARAATALNHKNIATVREFGYDENGGAYLVMDFVDGMSLSETIAQDGNLTPERTKKIISQVLDGLIHAHESGVVHRDLKPANIILASNADGEATAKIVDFGIAKLVNEENRANLTQTGEIFGTPNYMSPEQCLGKKADARSDIYAMGCVMYECLTGRAPFATDSALETLMKHVNQEPALSKKEIPADLAGAIQGCLEKNPNDRWQSAKALRQYLQDPRGAAQSKYKKTGKHFTARMAVATGLASAALIAFAAMFVAYPYLKPNLFPSPWQKLELEAQGQKSLGPLNYNEARVLLNKALEAAIKGGAGDADMEELYRQIAQLCTASGDSRGAIKAFDTALALNAKHKEDFNCGSMHDWLSSLYLDSKDYEKAVEHAKLAVDVKTKTIGANHPYTLLALLHLGAAYRGLKELKNAEEIDRKAVLLANKLYPAKDNVELANALLLLADVLADQHNVQEAIENYKLSLTISARVLGKDHPQTISNRDFIVSYLREHNHAAEAEAILKASGD